MLTKKLFQVQQKGLKDDYQPSNNILIVNICLLIQNLQFTITLANLTNPVKFCPDFFIDCFTVLLTLIVGKMLYFVLI